MDQNSQNTVLVYQEQLVKNSLVNSNAIFELLENYLKDAHILLLQKSIDNFVINHKTCYFFTVRGSVSLKVIVEN